MRIVLLARFLAAVVLACVMLPWAAYASERVALVIGNGAYKNAVELPNPSNDARDVAATLRSLGFEVIDGFDLDKAAMEAKVRTFVGALAESKVAILFYAGHGMQVDGENYLIPIDAVLADRTAVEFETVRVNSLLDYMKAPDRIAIALLDACRDNPLARRFVSTLGPSRSNAVGQGLAPPAAVGGGLLIGFATAPGSVAQDGSSRNSPFTTALLRELPVPGIEIQQVMTRVKADVFDMTRGEQEPWHNSNLREEFFMVPGASAPVPSANVPADQAAWTRVALSSSETDLTNFIRAWPQSVYAPLAQQKLDAVQVAKLDILPLSEPATLEGSEVLRSGPGPLFQGIGKVGYEDLTLLGRIKGLEDKGAGYRDWWLKVRTEQGVVGFIPQDQVIRAFAARSIAAHEKMMDGLQATLDASTGTFAKKAGFYTFNTCATTQSALNSSTIPGLAFLRTRAVWFRGNTMYMASLGPVIDRSGKSDTLTRAPNVTTLSYNRKFNAKGGVMHFYRSKNSADQEIIGLNGDTLQYDIEFKGSRISWKYMEKCDFKSMKYAIGEHAKKAVMAWQWSLENEEATKKAEAAEKAKEKAAAK